MTTALKDVEDAITGNTLDLLKETIYITTDAGQDATGTGVSGAQRADYVGVQTIEQLAKLLAAPSPLRARGIHEEQDVLIRAEAGTGKTWSIRQLVLLLAIDLLKSTEPVPLVPLLVCVQRLVKYSAAAKAANTDLLLQAWRSPGGVP